MGCLARSGVGMGPDTLGTQLLGPSSGLSGQVNDRHRSRCIRHVSPGVPWWTGWGRFWPSRARVHCGGLQSWHEHLDQLCSVLSRCKGNIRIVLISTSNLGA